MTRVKQQSRTNPDHTRNVSQSADQHRYFFEISYHGAAYNGWQRQENATGVQAVVEDVMSKVLRTPVTIVGSGRTDTGVHCEQQFFHTDLAVDIAPSLIQQLNSFLPRDISVKSARRVKPEASARYDAIERTYRYQITRVKNPFLQGLSWYYFKDLDVGSMNRAAAHLIGEHDFESFSKVKTDVNHFICEIRKAEWVEKGDNLFFTISANRFLRGMVRAVVGTLLDVGTGKITHREFISIIGSRDRRRAGQNVPACGLYLERVKYPARIFIK